eukprot:768283-Hanusia_phi.AAC.3
MAKLVPAPIDPHAAMTKNIRRTLLQHVAHCDNIPRAPGLRRFSMHHPRRALQGKIEGLLVCFLPYQHSLAYPEITRIAVRRHL